MEYKNRLKATYQNCTIIEQNVMIQTAEDYAFQFLEHVEEVYGSIEISGRRLTEISFPNLVIIRGQMLKSKAEVSGMLLHLKMVIFFGKLTFLGVLIQFKTYSAKLFRRENF